MGSDDFHVILAELRKDIGYIKDAVSEKFKDYDYKMIDVKTVSDKIIKIELQITTLETHEKTRQESMVKIWVGILTAIGIAIFDLIFNKF